MIKTDKVIIVEGKYDKIKLDSLVDGLIISTDGFDIFKNTKKLSLIKRLAEEKGVVILTDSDSAGFKIRGYLNGVIPNEKIINLYTPDLFGKEKRKRVAGKEGKLGVEGIPSEILRKILEEIPQFSCKNEEITTLDLYNLGLSGQKNSGELRKKLLSELSLPENLSGKRFCEIVSALYKKEEFYSVAERIIKENEKKRDN